MKKNMLLIVALLILMLTGFFIYKNNSGQAMLANQKESLEQNKIETVILTFSQNMSRVKPPQLDQAAIQENLSLLTMEAKERVEAGPNLSSGLAMFAGVQDVPDEGVMVNTINIQNNTADAQVQWNYSGQDVIKYFTLFKIDGSWKIDQIR